VWGRNGPVALGTPQQRSLLALLLLNANEVVSRDRLIDELWGASAPQSATKLVQVYVSRLRKALEPWGELLVTQAPGYTVRIEPDQLDVERFERLAGEGHQALAAGKPEQAAACLREGLDLWRGAPLADFAFETFAEAEVARLEELRLAALEDRIDADLALGRTGLVGEIDALVARHPLRERLRGQLMVALYRAGRQSEALAAFRDARRTLVDEVGVEPGPALRRLEQAILAHDPELDGPAAGVRAAESLEGDTTTPVPDSADVFVGRRAELDLFEEALTETEAGRGGIVLIGGQAGIGKSRLLDEVTRRARERQMPVAWGRCWEADGAPAYWPWIQSLRAHLRGRDLERVRSELGPRRSDLVAILPELGVPADAAPAPPSVGSEADRFRLFESVGSFLVDAARTEPLVLILDDLHAADEPSLLLLRYVAAEAATAPLLVIGAYRDVELEPTAPLALVVPELARERRTRQVTLSGLSETEVARLIAAAAGLEAPQRSVEAIHRGTEGNPLFVGEVVRLLSSTGRLDSIGASGSQALPLAPGVRAVIGGRLNRLSDDCRAVLVLAAALGREFAFTSLVEAGDRSEEEVLDALEEALAAQVISDVPDAPDRLRFAHALIRDTLYSELAGPRRARLHRTVGEALERRYAGDTEPHLAELAHHYYAAGAAGDPAKAVDYARAAGDRSVALFAYEEAVRLYSMSLEALGLLDGATDSVRCELLLALGAAQARGGEGTDAKASFLEAATLARSAGLPTLLARAAAGYGGRFVWTRALADDRLVPLLEEGLSALGEADDALRVRLLSRLGAALRGEPTRGRREQVCEEAIRTARRLGDPATLAYALDAAESAMAGPDTVKRRISEADETISIAQQIGDREQLFAGYEHRFWAVWELGDPARRRADMAALTAVAEELRQPAQLWSAYSSQAVLALSEGRFADGEMLMERAASTGKGAVDWSAACSWRLQDFMLRAERRQLEGLDAEVAGCADEFPSPFIHGAVLAFIHAHLGHRDDARSILAEFVAHDLRDWHVDEEWLASVSLLAIACARAQDAAQAPILQELLLPYATLTAVAIPELAIGPVARPLGLLATLLGRFADAETHFGRSLRLSALMGARPSLAHSEFDFARMLAARAEADDLQRARELAGRAVAGYRELGMDAFEAEARELSDRLGSAQQQ
jgi:DNA-binding SARP family transcriptional activator/tetratricopeptide (TPR) repeat protein